MVSEDLDEVSEDVEVAEEVASWVPSTPKPWKDHASFTINMVQSRGHVLTKKSAQ